MTDQTLTVRFFARLREELGTEQLTLPAEKNQTAGDLLAVLASRGGPWAQLQGNQPVMIAINQAMAKPAAAVKAGDEVAFFPPVTGG
ncbi:MULTISPECIES: molybdopterin converting factor subunit 1 [Marinobacter]|uniref:Molybdopterin synthase sulfur carrier subunit n=1 Tax=Marinobacter xiaoshiensis TaxID=3073652 RepID=A0ABU2HC03_9GAMM|nr:MULTISPECIES: molybdopterin converting factor subunit 1 [unclassified Marinobacter]MBK1873990.1 molybdopterin converting factor subunit 1 [Marinobacter sp. 1-3A]MBK1887968.1 molybdopterin converting factor subunit 1 [Marinobacter sp. DY40_1A1]MDS1308602.1 molybdopterin converting factor subunit 1 [Marinobacter sp. F60267]